MMSIGKSLPETELSDKQAGQRIKLAVLQVARARTTRLLYRGMI